MPTELLQGQKVRVAAVIGFGLRILRTSPLSPRKSGGGIDPTSYRVGTSAGREGAWGKRAHRYMG